MVKNPSTDYKSLPKGCFVTEQSTSFLLYAPDADLVEVQLFDGHRDTEPAHIFRLRPESDGFWWTQIAAHFTQTYYNYRVSGLDNPPTDGPKHEFPDPYSSQIVAKNTYLQPSKTVISNTNTYNWDGDSFIIPANHRELVIYETHIKDMVALSDPHHRDRGCYHSFIDDNHPGGLNHLKTLGVNAVEFLPLQHFAYHEPPFNQRAISSGLINKWNPYGINYWGYMPSNFFAIEPRYSSEGVTNKNEWTGQRGKAKQEFKDLVKTLHQEGIAVILDVVFNHLSHHDLNPLRYLAQKEYQRFDQANSLLNQSGCGNDFRSESEAGRTIILDAIRYWMNEYHIDGFRFDLAHLLDWETIAQIKEVVTSINPHAILIAEPWGGGYNPQGFSNLDWSCWNDQFRDGIRGANTVDQHGIAFGNYNSHTSESKFDILLQGSLVDQPGGFLYQPQHSVNYLDCHDGYTLGDFIRKALRENEDLFPIKDLNSYLPYTDEETKIARFMAMLLILSPGIPMLQAGQEWGRAKIITDSHIDDPKIGYPDTNSYNKDNATNYLDFDQIQLNPEIFEFYQSLIKIRQTNSLLTKADPEQWDIKKGKHKLQRIFYFRGKSGSSSEALCWLINANANNTFNWSSDQSWECIIASNSSLNLNQNRISTLELFPLSSVLLRKLRD